ncbi:hypothetical protein FHW12_000300 [Dokdonella fugitiva]|uniref:Cupin domain-containing protein n=1 Tax=Dokdonella fugitiva TaxID=328517 RepID=A0A839EWL8_9GAMM|nr:hypothetical protein [Dokdonella fugitiva]MBA8886109.1 hypothetical protein [Dokdonella fugitiva]
MIALPPFLLDPLRQNVLAMMASRAPDRIIGGDDDPYLLRWHLTERNRQGNAYAHEFRRSDDDRALHDHPWESCSIFLRGRYIEHTIAAGGVRHQVMRAAGDVVFRGPTDAHRIELIDGDPPPITLFLTGAVIRDWGFHCPDRGWVHWEQFMNPADGGSTIGRGCDA